MKEHTDGLLCLDTVPEGSKLPSMREMILDIKSVKFPTIPLTQSIDRTWHMMHYRGEHTCLCLPHLVEEAELIIHNLLPHLRHKHGDEVLLYFTEEAKAEAWDDGWDAAQNRVACATYAFLEEDLQNDIGLTDA